MKSNFILKKTPLLVFYSRFIRAKSIFCAVVMTLSCYAMLLFLNSCSSAEPKKEKVNYNEMILSCSQNGNLECVKTCIENGADSNSKNQYGNTALMWASSEGFTKIAELLLKSGADPNAVDIYGKTSLYFAKLKKYKDIEKLLRENGAKY